MRNNKAILDEAARSVRRTFIGTLAGSVGMLTVVGVAGAYGMPEKLTAQAFSLAMTKFNLKLPQGLLASAAPRPMRVAQNVVQMCLVARRLPHAGYNAAKSVT